MSSKQQDVVKSDISPVLFMSVDGEPMTFFLRPGYVKSKLQPLITAGGGMMCKVQQPGAILLMNPDERFSIPETSAHWYVSSQYIQDCIDKGEQLNLEDYRLKPEAVPRQSARLSNNKENSPVYSEAARIPYTNEDDAAILSFVNKHKAVVGGNRLWQEMERQRVTGHTWQSMKYRYRARLAKKVSGVEEVPTTEDEAAGGDNGVITQVEENQKTPQEKDTKDKVEKPASVEGAASPQMQSTEGDLTQIDVQSIPAESSQPENAEAQTSVCPKDEEQHVNPQTEKQLAESTQVETEEAEASNSSQPEGPGLDPLTDAHPIPAESAETDESQTIISPQKESMPEDSPAAQSLPGTSSQRKPREKQGASPKLKQTPSRVTRRRLQLEESSSPNPYGKKLRSSSSSAEQPSSSPRSSSKTKVKSVEPAPENDKTVDQVPSKRARRKSAAAVSESQQEESGQAAVSETTQAGTESVSVPQRGEKKKEKRKLGILELATKEFEDESESDEDEAADLQNPTETVTETQTEPPLPAPDAAASTQPTSEPVPVLQEDVQETQASTRNCLPETSCPQPAATGAAAVSVSSEAHLFIFERESQEEEDSQSIIGDSTAAPVNPQPTVNKDTDLSLTQVQLEEDMQRIRELMKEANQDLVSVTKALLKTSGDFSDALNLLLKPDSFSGAFWKHCDDGLLRSGDPVVRQQLQEKYGEEPVAKRIAFLGLEG